MKKPLLLFLTLFLTLAVLGQINQGGQPFQKGSTLKSVKGVVFIEKPNIDSLLSVVKNKHTEQKSDISAVAQCVGADIFSHETESWAVAGGRVYELTLHTKDAPSLIVNFEKYYLPRGAKVFVYNNLMSLGAFTSENNKQYKSLTLQEIPGNYAIVQLFVPEGKKDSTELKVGVVGYGIRKSANGVVPDWQGGAMFQQSLPCNNEINSLKGIFVQNEKRAVVKVVHLEYQFFVNYTAVLVNNYKNDGTPYFLTARHCFEKVFSDYEMHPEYARSAVAYFNYESPSPGVQGDFSNTISGADILCWDNAPKQTYLDIVLMRFDEKPSQKCNPYYAGLNAEKVDLSDKNIKNQCYTIIHHPKGDVKKVTLVSSLKNMNEQGVGLYKDDGVTERGSSGSPLFDSNHLVTANLSYGGDDTCDNMGNVYEGFANLYAGYDFFPEIRNLLFEPGKKKVAAYDPATTKRLMFFPNRIRVNYGSEKLYLTNMSSANYENFRWDFGAGANTRYFTGVQPGEIELKELGFYNISLTAFNKDTGKDEVFRVDNLFKSQLTPPVPSFYLTTTKGKRQNVFQYTDTVCVHNTSQGYADKFIFDIGKGDVTHVETTDRDKVIKLTFKNVENDGVTISMTQVHPDGSKIVASSFSLYAQTVAKVKAKWSNGGWGNIPENYYVLGKNSFFQVCDVSEHWNQYDEQNGINRKWYLNGELIKDYTNQRWLYCETKKSGINTVKLVVFNYFSSDSTTIDFDVHLTTGVNDFNRDEVNVFPTICRDHVYVQTSLSDINLEVLNTAGQYLVKQSQIDNNYSLNTSSFPSGVYFIVIRNKEKQKTIKIIKH